MKIIVDEVPNKCSECLFLKDKVTDAEISRNFFGITSTKNEISGVSLKKEETCTLLDKSIPRDISSETKLANCPLKEEITNG